MKSSGHKVPPQSKARIGTVKRSNDINRAVAIEDFLSPAFELLHVSTSFMSLLEKTTNLFDIPVEALSYIFHFISLAYIIPCLLVSRGLKKIAFSVFIERNGGRSQFSRPNFNKKIWQSVVQKDALRSLFKNGDLNFLQWFQQKLSYPQLPTPENITSKTRVIEDGLFRECISLATKGTMGVYMLFLFSYIFNRRPSECTEDCRGEKLPLAL